MSNAVNAVSALINTYAPNEALAQTLTDLFNSDTEFMSKVKEFDAAFAAHPSHSEVEEYAFDMLMTHHLSNHNADEDYFDSPEWQDIEDQTIERGTELLNMLLYISEAQDSDTPVDLEDFLYEFLLVDEDEFQDEHRIYEELIANQELVEESVGSIVEVASRIPESEEIKELFVPLMLFFQEPHQQTLSAEITEKVSTTDKAVLQALLTYANS